MAQSADIPRARRDRPNSGLELAVSRWLSALQSAALSRSFWPVCVLSMVLVRLLWITWLDVQPSSDFSWYYSQGERIASGRGYSVEHSGYPLWEDGARLGVARQTAFWPVGYPAFLGALFYVSGALLPSLYSHLLLAKIANLVLSVLTVLGLAHLAGVWSKSKLAERFTLLLAGFAPNQIAYVALTASEVFFTFLLVFGVLALTHATRSADGAAPRRVLSPAWLCIAGFAFGWASLTKPQTAVLPVIFLIFLAARRPATLLIHLLWVYVPLACVVLPWSVRNYFAFGSWVTVSTNGWMNLAIGNMPGSWGQSGVMWNEQLHEVVTRHADELSWNEGAKLVVLDYLKLHPIRVLIGLPGKVLALYAWDVDGFGWNRVGDPRNFGESSFVALRVLSQAHYVAALALTAYSWARLRHSFTRGHRASLALIAYFTLLYTLFFGGPRFHFPVMPFIYLFAALGLTRLCQRSARAALIHPRAQGAWQSPETALAHPSPPLMSAPSQAAAVAPPASTAQPPQRRRLRARRSNPRHKPESVQALRPPRRASDFNSVWRASLRDALKPSSTR